MSIRFGTNPIAWSNDDLRSLGADIPLERCLQEAAEAGFEGIELGHKFPRDPAELEAVLQAAGLTLVSGWYSTGLLKRDPEAEFERMLPHLERLRAGGSDIVIVAETSDAVHGRRDLPLSRRPLLPPEILARLARRTTLLAELAGDAGFRLAYHHHMGTVVQTAAEVEAFLLNSGPSVGLLLDSGHATFAGADPVDLARRHRERIAHVHCKDVRPVVLRQAVDQDWSFLDAVVAGVFTVPGDGGVDFPGLLRELTGYAGWLVVEAEQDPEKAPPLAYAKLGCDNLKRFAAEAGLT